jgi:hypothetical protein
MCLSEPSSASSTSGGSPASTRMPRPESSAWSAAAVSGSRTSTLSGSTPAVRPAAEIPAASIAARSAAEWGRRDWTSPRTMNPSAITITSDGRPSGSLRKPVENGTYSTAHVVDVRAAARPASAAVRPAPPPSSSSTRSAAWSAAMQHALYFFPDPQGQGSLREARIVLSTLRISHPFRYGPPSQAARAQSIPPEMDT